MDSGQSVTNSSGDVVTFIGIETVSLADKTFAACHLKELDAKDKQITEVWYAPGYGKIKGVANGSVVQYNGDL